jgi:hypothetical protein
MNEMGIKSNSGAHTHTLPYRGLQADHTIPQNLDGRWFFWAVNNYLITTN